MSSRLGMYRDIPNTRFIWNGEWADPEIEYDDEILNYNEVEDFMYDDYKSDCAENHKEPTIEDFELWLKEQGKDYIVGVMDDILSARNDSGITSEQ